MPVFDFRHRPIFDNFEGCDRKLEIVKKSTTIDIVFFVANFVLDSPLQNLHNFLGLAYLGESEY
jgi:hypothetical protein